MSLHTHSCIWFSPPNPELSHFLAFVEMDVFSRLLVALCCTRSSTDACAHQSRKVHTKSSSFPWVNGNSPFPPPEKTQPVAVSGVKVLAKVTALTSFYQMKHDTSRVTRIPLCFFPFFPTVLHLNV